MQVKITVPEGFHLDVENSWLGVDITSVANAYQSVFKLQENTKPAVLEHSSFFGEASKATVYNLQLNSQSQAEFAELQKYLQKSQAEGVAIRVVPKLASYPQAADNVEISIDLQLSSEEGYFTLIDGAELSLAKLRSKK
ncbi:hypothetical protein [Parendozoicomonas haliclonae]|uniref:hypothetical protein n=1 Tax=Parendozoicomonas haliclonae TaxID=1960125 RepID=UPI00105605A5|nr:hypothetical protein [Parendozoicomonas haliclonae]